MKTQMAMVLKVTPKHKKLSTVCVHRYVYAHTRVGIGSLWKGKNEVVADTLADKLLKVSNQEAHLAGQLESLVTS